MTPPTPPTSSSGDKDHFLRKQTNWNSLSFYKKSDVLYLLTKHFTGKYLSLGDRTIDQMVQAARSGKQNIVEGMSDGVASVKMEIKLLNVARSSLQELREDYKDYLSSRHLKYWDKEDERQTRLLSFCRSHNNQEDYTPLFERLSDEELSNLAITLCQQVDKMMTSWLDNIEKDFRENGGLSERMTALRLGHRKTQQETIEAQAHEIDELKDRIKKLETYIQQLETYIRQLEATNGKK